MDYQYRTAFAMRVATKVLFWLTCLAVMAVAVAPRGSLPSHVFEWWDKAQNVAAFATLMLLGRWAYPDSRFALPMGLPGLGSRDRNSPGRHWLAHGRLGRLGGRRGGCRARLANAGREGVAQSYVMPAVSERFILCAQLDRLNPDPSHGQISTP